MVSSQRAILQFVLVLTLMAGFPQLSYAELVQKQFLKATSNQKIALSFEDSQGNLVSLADFRGRYVLLNLWATWCGPCVREMPALDKVRAHFQPQRLQVIALTEDHDGLNVAKAFYTRHSLTHLPLFADSAGQAPNLLRIRGLPTTLLIDPEGREVGRIEGEAEWSTPDAFAFLEAQITR